MIYSDEEEKMGLLPATGLAPIIYARDLGAAQFAHDTLLKGARRERVRVKLSEEEV
jgi:hypothetical protein